MVEPLCVDVCGIIAEYFVHQPHEIGIVLRVSHQWREAAQQAENVWSHLVIGSPDRQPSLHRAAQFGCEDACRRLIDAGSDVNEQYTRAQFTPLTMAALHAREGACRLLLERGANMEFFFDHNMKNFFCLRALYDGETRLKPEQLALMLDTVIRAGGRVAPSERLQDILVRTAQWRGTLAICKALLTLGASTSTPNFLGVLPLHQAIVHNQEIPVIKVLLEAVGVDVNRPDTRGAPMECTMLLKQDRVDVAELLIAAGADIHIPVKDGSLLHRAAMRNCGPMCELLIRHGAQLTRRNDLRETPLDVAVRKKATDSRDVLLKADNSSQLNHYSTQTLEAVCATAVSQHNHDLCLAVATVLEDPSRKQRRWPAICVPVQHQDAEMCRLLAVRFDVNATGMRRSTALHLAAKRHADLCLMLLSAGANPNLQTSDGVTPLHVATNHFDDSIERVQMLIEAGVDVNCADRNGRTALHRAARIGCVALCELLLRHGAGTDAVDNDGLAPLAVAARGGFADVCDVLLRAGADVNASAAPHDLTAAHVAARHGEPIVFNTLVRAGADLTLQDSQGRTPFKIARRVRCTVIEKACGSE